MRFERKAFHGAFDNFAMQYPNVRLKRGVRFVEDGNLAISGGLTAGMDLAFRVVGRYFGLQVAEKLAFQIEYQGKGWMDSASNEVYAKYQTGQAAGRPALPSVFYGRKSCDHVGLQRKDVLLLPTGP